MNEQNFISLPNDENTPKHKFTVLLACYYKEVPEYLNLALRSIWEQDLQPSEILVVEDGPLGKELTEVLDSWSKRFQEEAFHNYSFNRIQLKKNLGLGLALAEGVKAAQYEWIARMDTDDISVQDRFKKMFEYLDLNPEIDCLGTQILEFSGEKAQALNFRNVPLLHEDIVAYQPWRSALNHVSVVFKKSKVLEAGNYEDCLFLEDDMLWFRMIVAKLKFHNLDEALVQVRTDSGMIDRRGGSSYFKRYYLARKQMYKEGFISFLPFFISILAQFVFSFTPKGLRAFLFKYILRRSVDQRLSEIKIRYYND